MLRLLSCTGQAPAWSGKIYEVIIPHNDMTRLKPGDKVDCRIKAATIVGPYSTYEEVKTFEIVAYDCDEYYLYIPHYIVIKGTVIADEYRCKKLRIDKKFLNESIVSITESQIASVYEVMNGMCCKVCKDFYQYAESNQNDGTLICWSCRSNPYR